MNTVKKKASDIYAQQNRLLHKAFEAQGMPYIRYKDDWARLFSEIAGRQVRGLSDLTLSERHRVILHFQSQGIKLFAPGVPQQIAKWKKGQPDIEHQFRDDDDPQVRMVYAIWTEMGYRERTLRGLCWKLFKINDPRWLGDRQLRHLVNVVRMKAERKGCGTYYKRRVQEIEPG